MVCRAKSLEDYGRCQISSKPDSFNFATLTAFFLFVSTLWNYFCNSMFKRYNNAVYSAPIIMLPFSKYVLLWQLQKKTVLLTFSRLKERSPPYLLKTFRWQIIFCLCFQVCRSVSMSLPEWRNDDETRLDSFEIAANHSWNEQKNANHRELIQVSSSKRW